MNDTPPSSGIDMARAALAAARAAAKTRPEPLKKTRRTRGVARTGGRDPIGLAAAITGMMTERDWQPPETGGSILDQWPTIAPELADKVAAVRFEHDTGLLHLQPVSPAYATQLRMHQAQILRRIHEKTGQQAVRALRILAPGAAPSPGSGDTGAQPLAPAAADEAPVRTRENAHPGYRHTLDLALTHRPSSPHADPYTVEAIARQDQALRAKRLPDDEHAEYLAERERLERLAGPAPGSSEASRAAALAYKRAEAAGRTQPRRAFDAA